MPLEGISATARLEENLVTFINLLRREGLPVGTNENMEAWQALQLIDLSSRHEFRSALQATLVKSSRHRVIFDRLFELFFAPHHVHRERKRQLALTEKQLEQQLNQAVKDLQFKGQTLKLSAEELAQYGSMSQEQQERLQFFMQKTETGVKVEERFRPVLETLVKSHLRYCRLKNREENPAGDETRESGFNGDTAGNGGTGSSESRALLSETDIQAIGTSYLPEAEMLLHRLSRKLALKIMRRRRKGPRSGTIDLRGSLRDNMRYGGALFKIRHRPTRRSKQQLLLLCDVSASMNRYSTFVIHFLHGLQESVRDLSCFCFSDDLENMSEKLRNRQGLTHLLNWAARRSETWGGGTNLGKSLQHLRTGHPGLLNSRTTVIVVSDTKTISIDSAIKELKVLKERTRRILWLNPLPVDLWSEYHSVGAVSALVSMWPCSTIAQLEEVLTGHL